MLQKFITHLQLDTMSLAMLESFQYLDVLAAYTEVQPVSHVRQLGSAGGFSGAQFWQVSAANRVFCLRRWPQEHPAVERLEFIQAVLRHVAQSGCSVVPVPLVSGTGRRYVRCDGHLWEMGPWMPGVANFHEDRSPAKLTAAMRALAQFHQAAATFPTVGRNAGPSPGIRQRGELLRRYLDGDLAQLAASVEPRVWPELHDRAQRILQLVPHPARGVSEMLNRWADRDVSLQPCIRDVWHDHVLFEGEEVTGMIDFGSMDVENVAADVARLLGSLARDDASRWKTGIEAYCTVRPLSEAELGLVGAFDRSTVLMSGLNWIDWLYRQGRVFESHQAIPGRLDEIIARLEFL